MSQILSFRSIRESLLEQARQPAPDAVEIATLQQGLEAYVRGVRKAIDRAVDFSSRGLLSEAASVIEDFPDLVRQAEALRTLPTSDNGIGRVWLEYLGDAAPRMQMPTQAEVDEIAAIVVRADEHRELVDALRVSTLRNEPVGARLRILKRLRAGDQRNRMWLDQIEALENAWIKQIADLRNKTGATRAELDDALVALEQNEWVAIVPRGLKGEILERVMPLRAAEAGDRYAALAREIHDAASLMDRDTLTRLEADWAKINLETGRMPDPALSASVATAFRWLTDLENEERAQAQFDAEVEQLERMLNEAKPAVEIERQVAVLRDARREAPAGLLDRAAAYVAAERESVRRRHRLFLVGAAGLALVLGAVGFFVVWSTAEARERSWELAALTSALDAKDATKTRTLAEAIRARGDEPDAELAATLARVDGFLKTRADRTAEIKKLTADLKGELTRSPARTRVIAMKGELETARADAEESELADIASVERMRAERLAELDQRAEKDSRDAVAGSDAALKSWKLPSAWSDASQIDESEWSRYIAVLESALRSLDEAEAATEGYEAGASRIALKRDAVDARLTEAKGRLEALTAANRDLGPIRLCASVTVEEDFSKRIADALASHGAILARQGRLADFEAARDMAPAWRSIQAWRDDHRPKLAALIGPRLDGDVSPDQQARALEILNDFRGKFPASPFADALDGLAARLDPSSAGSVWPPDRVAMQLNATRLEDLEEVPLVNGRRFYRRSLKAADPRNSAVENLGDLMADPAKLDSILSVKREEIVGKAQLNEISVAWTTARERLGSAAMSDVRAVLLDLIDAIMTSKSDPLLRFRALQEASAVLEQGGHVPSALAQPLAAWRERLRKEARNATIADWARAGYEPEVDFRDARREAVAALEKFPNIKNMLGDARLEQARATGALQPLVPWGVLEPAAGDAPRKVAGRRESGAFYIVQKRADRWEVAEISIQDGVAAPSNGTGSAAIMSPPPKGPVIVFRRSKP
jgi:hypothetical protein